MLKNWSGLPMRTWVDTSSPKPCLESLIVLQQRKSKLWFCRWSFFFLFFLFLFFNLFYTVIETLNGEKNAFSLAKEQDSP